MIKLINNPEDFDRAMLLKSLNGKKMLAYLKAYGTGYDFCRFYKIENIFYEVETYESYFDKRRERKR